VPVEPTFERCRRLVLEDPALERRLREIPDWPSFTTALVELAGEHGIELTPEQVEAERGPALLAWLARGA
jgi:hypothetical protein